MATDGETGFEIRGHFYPLAESFRLGDPMLVEKVTGLSWPEFTERLPDDDDAGEDIDEDVVEDIVVLAGLLAVAVWQKHPHWRRDRVATYVEQLELDKVKFVGGDAGPGDGDGESPPGEAQETSPGASTSETSPPRSPATPGSPPAPPSRSSSGAPASAIGSPA